MPESKKARRQVWRHTSCQDLGWCARKLSPASG